jgi:hypothetical protein
LKLCSFNINETRRNKGKIKEGCQNRGHEVHPTCKEAMDEELEFGYDYLGTLFVRQEFPYRGI